jgi:hypothetical protein
MSRSPRADGVDVLASSVAPFLILLAPFVAYLHYQRHSFANPEVVVSVLLLAAVGLILGALATVSPLFGVATLAALLTLLVDIQVDEVGLKRLGLLFLGLSGVLWIIRQHAHRIVSLMMVTVILLSFLSPRSQAVTMGGDSPATRPAPRADLPFVFHLILDEFIGPDGLPADLAPQGFKQELESFFLSRGFRLFPKSYSEYMPTVWSVPQLLNLAPVQFRPELTEPGPSPGTYRLTQNAYFERLAGLGYAIQVHEPDFLYLCPQGLPSTCRTYATRSLALLDNLDVPLRTKLAVVAGTFFGQSEAYTRTKTKYRSIRRRLAGKVPLPAWNWERGTPGTAGSMPMFDVVAKDLANAQRGTFVFAHILMPHYPYIFDGECRQRPPRDWLERTDADRADVPRGITNVAEGRAERYALYFAQVECTKRKIDELLDSIPAPLRRDAILIVQGDHGSRITMVDPTTVANTDLSVSDYADAFSTMFAVRAPSIEAGSDDRMAPITCLLRTLVESHFQSVAGVEACSSPRIVYFSTGGKAPVSRPLPDFSAGRDAHAARGPTN